MEQENFEKTGRSGYQRETTPLWFVVISIAVFLWALYYTIKYWDGLGPGIGY